MNLQKSSFIFGILIGTLLTTLILASYLRGNLTSTASQITTLKLGHSLDPSHPVHAGMEHMKKRLEELSNGKMSMEIYPSEQLGSETQMMEMLQSGELAMTKTSAAPMEGFVPEMGVFGIPYVFKSREHYWNVLDSDLGRELLVKGENKNLRGLCYYDSGSRNFYTIDRAINSPNDLKGLKIRVMNSQMAIKMVEAMGGAPTPIAWGELYSALQQGIVDGAENNPPSFVSNKHYEVCKHFTMDGHTRIPDMLVISTPIFKGLSAQQQAWVQQAADESSVFQRELWQKSTLEALAAMTEKHGVTIHQVDLAPFRAAVAEMVNSLQDSYVGPMYNKIQGVK
jgi:tripartite ATP-independent transporter DctP family solute receptor